MPIEGVAGLEVEIKRNGEKVTLAKMILNLKDDKGKALFSGIKQTKFTNEYGHYLVLTQKNVIDVAEAKFDELLLNLANEGKLDAFHIEGTFFPLQSSSVSPLGILRQETQSSVSASGGHCRC
jgi:hypothetical protein